LHNVECAEYLAERVDAIPELELVRRPQLSICCFRYIPAAGEMAEVEIDRLNDTIVHRLAVKGDFLLSSTSLGERSILRVCIRSYTTRAIHIDRFIEQVCSIGKECEREFHDF
ncbi:MAG TPA: hypothetical protein VJ981_02255, partial [Gammaproteobacteria bacterium]|nr:hypothetical protein [Gammaproteobacteria bacterium]